MLNTIDHYANILLEKLEFSIYKHLFIKIDLIDILNDSYQQQHRFYHSFKHAYEVALFCENKLNQPEEQLALNLAAWFHDVVYSPMRNDNEEKSAIFLQNTLNSQNKIIDQAKNLIIATKNHLKTKDSIEKILIDADLFIFSKDHNKYKQYADDIRKEYTHLSDIKFNTARISFLNTLQNHILANGKLYHTLDKKHEVAAMKNIRNEIKFLTSKILEIK